MLIRTYQPGIAPGDVLDYSFDWSLWLGDGIISNSDNIMLANVTSTPDLTLSSPPDVTGAVVTVTASGAVLGTVYTLTCTITTATGRVANRSVNLPCVAL